jgi:hypothetical protein
VIKEFKKKGMAQSGPSTMTDSSVP